MSRVSVVVPTHNRSALLALTLRSVIRQREVDLEVIVVDDGSTDDTSHVVRPLDDQRVRLVRHPTPQGVSAARNRGIAESEGEWIAFLDDDDLWAPDKLSSQVDAARESGCGWVYVGSINMTVDHAVLGGGPPSRPEVVAERLPRANLVPGGCSGVMAHRDLLGIGFDGGYRHFADWDMWIRLGKASPPAWVPRPLVARRWHPSNASLDTEGMIAELDLIQERYGEPVDRRIFYRHVARVSLRAGRRGDAIRYYLHGAPDLEYLRHQFRLDTQELLKSLIDQGRRRLGWPARSGRRPPGPYSAWRDEAVSWIEEFLRDVGTPPKA